MSTRAKLGRPLKHAPIFSKLEAGTLYCPATIASFAQTIGYIKKNDKEKKVLIRRIRATCFYIIKKYFPSEPDGMLQVKGQHPLAAYYGYRFQEVISAASRLRRNQKLKTKRRRNKIKKGAKKDHD